MNISKKIILISLLAFGTISCNSSKIVQLESENVALKKQVDSLSSVANTYKKGMEREREMSRISAMVAERMAKMAKERAEKAAASKK